MSAKTLFLALQDNSEGRNWFPIGRLDADVDGSNYRFRYTRGAKRAGWEAGLATLLGFPDLEGDYRSTELFPLFRNRVMRPVRPDFPEYLQTLGLKDDADPVDILSSNGGRCVTDSFEVFPKPVRDEHGRFTCRFLLHGIRYMNEAAQKRLERLEKGDGLLVAAELNNPLNELALQVQTVDRHVIGYAPRYLAEDLAVTKPSAEVQAQVVRVNPPQTPASRRVLVQVSGTWDKHEPMSGPDYRPLVE